MFLDTIKTHFTLFQLTFEAKYLKLNKSTIIASHKAEKKEDKDDLISVLKKTLPKNSILLSLLNFKFEIIL